MSTLTLHIKAKDYAAWRPYFDAFEKNRVSAGVTNARVFRKAEDANDITSSLRCGGHLKGAIIPDLRRVEGADAEPPRKVGAMSMNPKQRLIAFTSALAVVAVLGISPSGTSSYAAAGSPHAIARAPKPAPPNQAGNADLLKKISELETRVADIEKEERSESQTAKPQYILPPGGPPMLPPTLKDQIDSLINDVKALQSQVTALQAQVAADALKYESEITNVANSLRSATQQATSTQVELQTMQASLQQLQKTFANHTHSYSSMGAGIDSIPMMDCQYSPCQYFGKTIQVLIPSGQTSDTYQTSGPVSH